MKLTQTASLKKKNAILSGKENIGYLLPGIKLGITKKITTYMARHTFSTVLKRSGASTEFIQEALGHTDLKTTENYLDSFEKDVKKEYANRLIAFEGQNTLKQVL